MTPHVDGNNTLNRESGKQLTLIGDKRSIYGPYDNGSMPLTANRGNNKRSETITSDKVAGEENS